MVGKKGIGYFRFLRRAIARGVTDLGDSPRFDQIEPIANDLMDRFGRGEIASAHIAYMRFHSAGVQRPEVMQLLPLDASSLASADGKAATESRTVEFEFSPEPAELLDELLPATVRVRLFQCFSDAIVSEHIARMVAMKAATDAAGDMNTTLTRQYNRARQTQITMELLDIVGGVNALA
jgi:F-type H+-transporting ATPase subunit gamma